MNSNTTKVAMVTGANKGIGFAIVKGLCEKFEGKVYLTARNERLGNEAVKKLKQLGLNPVFHQLDLNNLASVNSFKRYIETTEGGIDILINNAGISSSHVGSGSPGVQAEATMATNYFGTLRVCNALFPLLRPNAQVVNVSSSRGHLAKIPSAEIREKLSHPTLTIEGLSEIMHQYVQDAKENKHVAKGWGSSMYLVSKVAVCALTIIQQKEFDKDPLKRNISVNSVHPGYVSTDMTSYQGPLSVERGARAPLYLALEPHKLKGEFVWYDTKVIDWFSSNSPAEIYI